MAHKKRCRDTTGSGPDDPRLLVSLLRRRVCTNGGVQVVLPGQVRITIEHPVGDLARVLMVVSADSPFENDTCRFEARP